MTLSRQIQARWAQVADRIAAGPVDRRRHVIVHIGPHRTGTTTIQTTMRASANAAPTRFGLITQKHETQFRLNRLTYGVTDAETARARAEEIRTAAQDVAQATAEHDVAIISDEDMLGPLPTKRQIKGLYPFLGLTLPPLIDGLRADGARVTIAWQYRDYADWLESVYHRRHKLAPEVPFDFAKVVKRNKLPKSWRGFERRLKIACAGATVARLSFAEDATSGMMGQGLFALAGMSAGEIAALRHANAANSSPMRGTVARFAKSAQPGREIP